MSLLITRPDHEPTTKYFSAWSEKIIELADEKGHIAQDASKRSKAMFEKSYKDLLSSNSDANALQDARLLWWNMTHQVCLGNNKAKI